MSDAAQTLAIIPARGGSDELKRKNLLPDAYGVPLVLASARAARDAGCTVVVSTDDAEIASLATIDGHIVHDRGDELASVLVDEVVAAVVFDNPTKGLSGQTTNLGPWTGPVLLVQPTVQPITHPLLRWFLKIAAAGERPVALGVEDRHLIWAEQSIDPTYKLLTDRAERTSQLPWPIREMGVRWWPNVTDVQHPPATIIAWPHHLVDIDTAADYRQISRRLNIWFQLRANKEVGTGHLRRVLTLAEG